MICTRVWMLDPAYVRFCISNTLPYYRATHGIRGYLAASVAASDIATADTTVSENLLRVGVLDVNDGRPSRGDGARRALGRGISESNGAKVSKGNKAAAGLEVCE